MNRVLSIILIAVFACCATVAVQIALGLMRTADRLAAERDAYPYIDGGRP